MEVSKGGCILILIIFETNFWEIEGQEPFFTDFLKRFNIENPVFISADEFDQDIDNNNKNFSKALIRYTTNKDEDEVASHLQNLFLLGDLAIIALIESSLLWANELG